METPKVISSQKKLTHELFSISSYKELFYALIRKNIRLKYQRKWLGVLWAIFQPLTLTFIFYFFLKTQLGERLNSYFLFLLIGFSFWSFFASATQSASESFLNDRSMIRKASFPLLILPLASASAKLFDLILISAVLIITLVVMQPQLNWLLFIPVFILSAINVFCFALAFGLCFALITVKMRDFKVAVTFIIQLILFSSPIFYDAQFLANFPIVQDLYRINPIAGSVGAVRNVAFDIPVEWYDFLLSFGVAILSLLVALFVYGTFNKKIPDYL